MTNGRTVEVGHPHGHVSWGEALPTVAGELMSNLILRHALPNANHRTSIAMLQFCIESVVPSFEMPPTHADDETWQNWVDPFIVESKRLITVRRNNVRFKHLQELGVDLVPEELVVAVVRVLGFEEIHPVTERDQQLPIGVRNLCRVSDPFV
nr:hypothetical protein [Halovivax limisalsi]